MSRTEPLIRHAVRRRFQVWLKPGGPLHRAYRTLKSIYILIGGIDHIRPGQSGCPTRRGSALPATEAAVMSSSEAPARLPCKLDAGEALLPNLSQPERAGPRSLLVRRGRITRTRALLKCS